MAVKSMKKDIGKTNMVAVTVLVSRICPKTIPHTGIIFLGTTHSANTQALGIIVSPDKVGDT